MQKGGLVKGSMLVVCISTRLKKYVTSLLKKYLAPNLLIVELLQELLLTLRFTLRFQIRGIICWLRQYQVGGIFLTGKRSISELRVLYTALTSSITPFQRRK